MATQLIDFKTNKHQFRKLHIGSSNKRIGLSSKQIFPRDIIINDIIHSTLCPQSTFLQFYNRLAFVVMMVKHRMAVHQSLGLEASHPCGTTLVRTYYGRIVSSENKLELKTQQKKLQGGDSSSTLLLLFRTARGRDQR